MKPNIFGSKMILAAIAAFSLTACGGGGGGGGAAAPAQQSANDGSPVRTGGTDQPSGVNTPTTTPEVQGGSNTGSTGGTDGTSGVNTPTTTPEVQGGSNAGSTGGTDGTSGVSTPVDTPDVQNGSNAGSTGDNDRTSDMNNPDDMRDVQGGSNTDAVYQYTEINTDWQLQFPREHDGRTIIALDIDVTPSDLNDYLDERGRVPNIILIPYLSSDDNNFYFRQILEQEQWSSFPLNLEYAPNRTEDGFIMTIRYNGTAFEEAFTEIEGGRTLNVNDLRSGSLNLGVEYDNMGYGILGGVSEEFGELLGIADASLYVDLDNNEGRLTLNRFRTGIEGIPLDTTEYLSDHDVGFDEIIVDKIRVNGQRLSGGETNVTLRGRSSDLTRLLGDNQKTTLNGRIGGAVLSEDVVLAPDLSLPAHTVAYAGGIFNVEGNEGTLSSGFFVGNENTTIWTQIGACFIDPTYSFC